MGKPWENGMLGEVGNVGMANMERSHHFSWENSLFRLGHGFNSYFDITRMEMLGMLGMLGM